MERSSMYQFDWDEAKAASNLRKHGVNFECATQVFIDPLAVTCFDVEHSGPEERWVTIGHVGHSTLVVFHTLGEAADGLRVRVISARHAMGYERMTYENHGYFVRETTVKDEYDFSKGEQGKFYRPNAVFYVPVYLDTDVLYYFADQAQERRIPTSQFLSEKLRREMKREQAATADAAAAK